MSHNTGLMTLKTAEMVEFQNLIEARFKRQFNRDIFRFFENSTIPV